MFSKTGELKQKERGVLMSVFVKQMQMEKKRLEAQVARAVKKLDSAPEGSLSIRKRKNGKTYYRNTAIYKNSGQRRKQTNITNDQGLIKRLTEKMIQKKILLRAQCNLIYLNKMLEHYRSTEIGEIKSELGPQYQDALGMIRNDYLDKLRNKDYPKAPFDSRYHIHETDCGEMVRSKSEQILLNTMTPYQEFIVHYEEEFLYTYGVEGLGRVYPDFTIILPNGKRIIWEHWGRLDDPKYCERNALKLCLYHKNGYVIGDNLIITTDDYQGNISSTVIRQAIDHILSKI